MNESLAREAVGNGKRGQGGMTRRVRTVDVIRACRDETCLLSLVAAW